MDKKAKIIYWLIFVVYMIILVKVAFVHHSLESTKNAIMSASLDRISSNLKAANFMPLASINTYMDMYFRPGIKLIGMGILWFVPLGYFIPKLTRHKRFKHTMIIGLIIIILIEVLQLIMSLGRFDIDDIILNGIGILFGFMIYKALK